MVKGVGISMYKLLKDEFEELILNIEIIGKRLGVCRIIYQSIRADG